MTKTRYPDLHVSPLDRARFQKLRNLIELIRTAPKGASIYSIMKDSRYQPTFWGRGAARLAFRTLFAEPRFLEWMDPRVVNAIRGGGMKGLGKQVDPNFDPKAEPPWINHDLATKILATPRLSDAPLLEIALTRLGGKLPFRSHNVMMINHRYSDIVPFADAMVRAGMSADNAVFVSTPYPFDGAVDYQLRDMGIKTLIPKRDMRDMARKVEDGIREMLRTHERNHKTILILDDGGMAAKVIGEKFKEHIGKFKIVEITAAGYRLAQEFKQNHKRLPFVYFSIAYSEAKRKITSRFFAKRVVERTLHTIDTSRLALANKRVAVIGGGPMGRYAGETLRAQGYDVTFVDPKPEVAAELRRAKFNVEPIEKALVGRGLVLGMSGYQTMREEHLKYIDDGAIVVQGSSKRNEFDMERFETIARAKDKLPRDDGLPQESFTYTFGNSRGKKRIHFLGDGWTINHDGSLHGTPISDIQLELAIIFESAREAAETPAYKTGEFRTVGANIQDFYTKVLEKYQAQHP